MREPIKAGDICEVICGMGIRKSPNLGLRVMAISLQGDHSKFGRVWRCSGEGVKQLTEAGGFVTTGWADFPTDWLKKIEPDTLPPEAVTTQKEMTT